MKIKSIKYIANKQKRGIWLRAFHIWQSKPHAVAPLSETTYECASCGNVFQGNYCPRCGQSGKVGRFSFKKAMLLFFDVWGVGNRSMFRSIRDLMLRPGYMIRDYLRGMQSAYFPPFKMFFLLTAFSLVVEHGISFGLDENKENAQIPTTEMVETEESEEAAPENNIHTITSKEANNPLFKTTMKMVLMMDLLRRKNPAIFSLLSLLLFSVPLFIFFRSTPTIPDLRYPEFFVALVYTSNTYSIYSIVGNLLGSSIIGLIAVLMIFVALKQFSGFSKLRVLRNIIFAFLITIIVLTVLIGSILLIVQHTS